MPFSIRRVHVCERKVMLVPPGGCETTSDNFHLIFPPRFFFTTTWWHFSKTLKWCRHYHTFTNIYSLLIEKSICDCWNISRFCVFVCTFIRRFLHFLVEFSLCFLFVKILFQVINSISLLLIILREKIIAWSRIQTQLSAT